MGMMQLIAASGGGGDGETIAFLIIGVLGLALGCAVYLVPGAFDAATRFRLRMQGLPQDDKHTLDRDRERRRFIAFVLAIGSTVIIVQGLTRI
jgi:hypothetical protein